MLCLAAVFIIIPIIAIVVSFGSLAGVLFFIFLVAFVVSLLMGVFCRAP